MLQLVLMNDMIAGPWGYELADFQQAVLLRQDKQVQKHRG